MNVSDGKYDPHLEKQVLNFFTIVIKSFAVDIFYMF